MDIATPISTTILEYVIKFINYL